MVRYATKHDNRSTMALDASFGPKNKTSAATHNFAEKLTLEVMKWLSHAHTFCDTATASHNFAENLTLEVIFTFKKCFKIMCKS